MIAWDTHDAESTIREGYRRDAEQAAALEAGPCPHCGAPADVEVFDVTQMGGPPQFVPGRAHCSADCWELDPEGYLESVDALATTRQSGSQTVQQVPNPLLEGPKRQNGRIRAWFARSGE